MNKKGFAASVVLYSIVLLVISTIFVLLGISRTRYTVTSRLRKNIINSINDEVGVGAVFPSSEKCNITSNTNNYTDNLVLTINVNNGSLYSWDNSTYTVSNTVVVNHGGTYTGYFRDRAGGTGSCTKDILSKTQYSYRMCPNANISYTEWYLEESISESCAAIDIIDKSTAEANNTDTYRLCEESTGYVKTYKRDATGCSDWQSATWSDWSDTFIDSSPIKETRSQSFYKAK
jgi:hypothetical protein